MRVFQALVHEAGPGQEFLHVDAHQVGRQQAHGGEHREAAADVGRDAQGGKAFLAARRRKGPLFRVGGDDEAFPGLVFAHPVL